METVSIPVPAELYFAVFSICEQETNNKICQILQEFVNKKSKKQPKRPKKGGKTVKVWEIADNITKKNGKKADRKSVLKECISQGVNPSTALTQYSYWSNNKQ